MNARVTCERRGARDLEEDRERLMLLEGAGALFLLELMHEGLDGQGLHHRKRGSTSSSSSMESDAGAARASEQQGPAPSTAAAAAPASVAAAAQAAAVVTSRAAFTHW